MFTVQAAFFGLCAERGALYLDTNSEPWEGGYTDTSIPLAHRTVYAQRQEMLEVAARMRVELPDSKSTAVMVRSR